MNIAIDLIASRGYSGIESYAAQIVSALVSGGSDHRFIIFVDEKVAAFLPDRLRNSPPGQDYPAQNVSQLLGSGCLSTTVVSVYRFET